MKTWEQIKNHYNNYKQIETNAKNAALVELNDYLDSLGIVKNHYRIKTINNINIDGCLFRASDLIDPVGCLSSFIINTI